MPVTFTAARNAQACPGCGAQIAPGLKACPACGKLVHAARLQQIAAEADGLAGEPRRALELWRKAIELLPEGTRQHELITARIDALSRQVESLPASGDDGAADKRGWRKWVGGSAILAPLLFVLGKGKFLVLGLTKLSTFLSMAAFFAVYWVEWGWMFALGIVVSIYIHEMGHVAALRRFGLAATPPMFIPGLGALVLLKQHPATPREDARIGLAGPWWGMGAAMAAWGIYLWTREPIWAAIAHAGAWINLFNLFPIWQLDGGRGFNAFSRLQSAIAVAAAGLLWFWTREGMLVLIGLGGVFRAVKHPRNPGGDRPAFLQYVTLLAVLATVTFLLKDVAAR